MPTKMEPDISPYRMGELGIFHLHRYWQKCLLEAEGRLDLERVRNEYGLDFTLLHGLGLGIVEPAEYLFHSRPSFSEFEQWIVNKLGSRPEPALVTRLNDMVRRYLDESRRVFPVMRDHFHEPVLSADDLAFWQENGYVVLREAVSKADCRAAELAIWEHAGLNPDEPATWRDGEHRFWVSLFQHPALIKNRASLRIRKAFEQLWGTDDLWTTVDRSSLNLPVRNGINNSGPSNLHWDVSLALPMPFGIQGLLYLTDTSAEQGAFRCVEGFHHRLESWMASVPPSQNCREQNLESLGPVAIPGSAGDLVLWNHALPHGSGLNLAQYPRVVQYITMFPHDYGMHAVWK